MLYFTSQLQINMCLVVRLSEIIMLACRFDYLLLYLDIYVALVYKIIFLYLIVCLENFW
jgi:hypothetical protein